MKRKDFLSPAVVTYGKAENFKAVRNFYCLIEGIFRKNCRSRPEGVVTYSKRFIKYKL